MSARRNPLRPPVFAAGLKGWIDKCPALPCLMTMNNDRNATNKTSKPISVAVTRALILMFFNVVYAMKAIAANPASIAVTQVACTPRNSSRELPKIPASRGNRHAVTEYRQAMMKPIHTPNFGEIKRVAQAKALPVEGIRLLIVAKLMAVGMEAM